MRVAHELMPMWHGHETKLWDQARSSINHGSWPCLKHVLNARQVLKSVAACLQRERDSVRSDLLKADQENQTLSAKVADLTCKLSEASSQIESLPNDGGSSKAGGNSGQEFVSKDAPEDAAQNVALSTSQVTKIKSRSAVCICL